MNKGHQIVQHFLFGDLETGGLNGRLDNGKLGMEYYPIFELAFIVTDSNLVPVGDILRIVIHHSEEVIATSSLWALKTHTDSGLIKEVKSSNTTLNDAELMIIQHLKSLGINSYDRKEKTGAVFAGNSIMFDRSYIMCQMPLLHEYLHYRQLDISALAIAARAFKPELEKEITSKKQYKHEALADIRESIAELKMYRAALFAGK